MIEIPDVKPMRACWTEKAQWESGFHRSAIPGTYIEIARENYLLQIVMCLNQNLEPQFETYWGGNGRLEGVAVIEPEKERPLTKEEAKTMLHPINFMQRFHECPLCGIHNVTEMWAHLKAHLMSASCLDDEKQKQAVKK